MCSLANAVLYHTAVTYSYALLMDKLTWIANNWMDCEQFLRWCAQLHMHISYIDRSVWPFRHNNRRFTSVCLLLRLYSFAEICTICETKKTCSGHCLNQQETINGAAMNGFGFAFHSIYVDQSKKIAPSAWTGFEVFWWHAFCAVGNKIRRLIRVLRVVTPSTLKCISLIAYIFNRIIIYC